MIKRRNPGLDSRPLTTLSGAMYVGHLTSKSAGNRSGADQSTDLGPRVPLPSTRREVKGVDRRVEQGIQSFSPSARSSVFFAWKTSSCSGSCSETSTPVSSAISSNTFSMSSSQTV